MIRFSGWFQSPPQRSPSATPALGLALCLNVLLFAGVHLGMAFGASATPIDAVATDLMRAAPVIYLVLLLPIIAIYGIAAAAWTGWSWWRVPMATLSAAALALGLNAWAMARWIASQGWPVSPPLSISDPRIDHLLLLALVSAATLGLVALSLYRRWLRE